MRSKTMICLIAIAGWFSVVCSAAAGQENRAADSSDDKAKLAAAHMELSKPGEGHHRLGSAGRRLGPGGQSMVRAGSESDHLEDKDRKYNDSWRTFP
jgi:hypothetical protein